MLDNGDTTRSETGLSEGWNPVAMQWNAAKDEDIAEAGFGALLRPWTQHDLDRYVALLDDPEVWRFLPEDYPAPLGRALARDLIALSQNAEHHIVRAIIHAGQPVGQVRLSFVPGDMRREMAEIGYWLGRAYWRHRIATEAVTQFSACAFAMLPQLRAQFARVHPENRGSLRLMARLGFSETRPDPETPGFLRLTRYRP